MLFTITGHHIGAVTSYAVSMEGTDFICRIINFEGKTCYDKVPEEITLFKVRGKWHSNNKIYRELTKTLGASIDAYLKEQKIIAENKS
jgi:hypothetical protein